MRVIGELNAVSYRFWNVFCVDNDVVGEEIFLLHGNAKIANKNGLDNNFLPFQK